MPGPDDDMMIFVQSVYGFKTRMALVEIQLGAIKTRVDATKAKEIAHMILEAAEASMSDALMIQFLITKIGLKIEDAAAVLNDFRDYRQSEEERHKARSR